MDLHQDVTHLASLLGTWVGAGRGEYPTIDPFEYVETVTFTHIGKPFLAYQQRTLSAGTEPTRPLHAESGYWRCPSPGRIELILSHPTGITEVDEGSITVDEQKASLVVELHSTTVGLSSTAKSVTEIHRSFRVIGDSMSYHVAMAAVGQPLQHHLEATLSRQPG